MTAITKVWVAIADTAVDPDSPIDSALMTGYRDDLEFLKQWLGASFFAGAVQDHNHDGVNSAQVPVGPNLLRNGSFESALSGWTQAAFTGGTIALNSTAADVYDGAYSAAITSTVLANGGGTLQSNEFVPVMGNQGYAIFAAVLASVAGVSGKIEVEWYDITQALISSTAAYNSGSVPTGYTTFNTFLTAPATARYMRVLCTGGIPATGTAVGTVYFDGIFLTNMPQLPSGASGVTQPSSDASTLLATDAFVQNVVNNGLAHLHDLQNLGVYSTQIMGNYGGVAANGALAGSAMKTVTIAGNGTMTQSASYVNYGTWRNIGGSTVPSSTIGIFQRIA